MGSTFFDLGLLFNEKPKKIFGIIDKTGTTNQEEKSFTIRGGTVQLYSIIKENFFLI